MPWDGSGNFILNQDFPADRDAGPPDSYIQADLVDNELQNIRVGLNNVLTRDGQNSPSADLPMGTQKHTNVGIATGQLHYLRADQAQKRVHSYLTSVGGTADAITATAGLAMTAYAAGQEFTFIPTANNTSTTPTININAIGALTIKRDASAALVANDIVSGRPAHVFYNGTDALLLNPATVAASQLQVSYLPLAGGTMTGTLNMSGSAAITMGAACVNESEGSAIASASTVNLNTATGNFVHITGTTTITAITLGQGWERTLVFDDALTLTSGASLILDGANITTAAGDVAVFRGEGGGVTRLVAYKRVDGRATTLAPAAGEMSNLKIEVTSNTAIGISADRVTVFTSAGTPKTISTVSLPIAITTSGANGLDTGSEASNTWYYVYVIHNPTTATTAGLLSTSATSPTLPSGYTYFRRVGAVRNDNSSNLYRTLQKGKIARYVIGTNPSALLSMASGSASTWTAVATGAFVPTTAQSVAIHLITSGAGATAVAAPNSSYAGFNDTTNPPPLSVSVATGSASQKIDDMLLESTSIYWGASSAAGNLFVRGWEDNL